MEKKDWKEYRNAVYHSNISPKLTGKIMVALDNYFKLLQEDDINTIQGAKSYLKNNGVDVGTYVSKGLNEISKRLGR